MHSAFFSFSTISETTSFFASRFALIFFCAPLFRFKLKKPLRAGAREKTRSSYTSAGGATPLNQTIPAVYGTGLFETEVNCNILKERMSSKNNHFLNCSDYRPIEIVTITCYNIARSHKYMCRDQVTGKEQKCWKKTSGSSIRPILTGTKG